MASKVSPHSTRARKFLPRDVTASPQSQKKSDVAALIETAVKSAIQEAEVSLSTTLKDTLKTAVSQMASTIGEQLASDMRDALRNISDEMERLSRRLKACEAKLQEQSASVPAPAPVETPPSSSTIQRQTFDIDRLEQYSRRDNIRVRGIPQKESEDTDQIIIDLAKECGITMSKQDISTSHRTQNKTGAPPTIIARLVRRDVKISLMRAKKVLRNKHKNIYIDEDLTPLRAKMFFALRKDPDVDAVWTIDGRIHCKVRSNGKEQKAVVDSPDDLFAIGWSEDKMRPFFL